MAYKAKNLGGANKGAPTQSEKSKAEVKVVDHETLDQRQEISDKYTIDDAEPDPRVVPVSHPNRNLHKEHTDRPGYGGT